MKHTIKTFLTIFIGLFLSNCVNGQIKTAENALESSSNSITPEQVQLIYSNVNSFPDNTELSIAIIENGKTKFIGVKRTNDTIKQIENKQKVFEIGSISKVFTSTLLSNLVEEGKVKLTDPIQDYIDYDIKTNQIITFKQLANHTSGLPALPSNLDLFTVDPNNPYKEYDKEKLKEYLTEKIELSQQPGEKYQYSNLGAGILGFVLTEITGLTYENLLQKKIFSRYNMTSSTTNKQKVEEKLIKGLNPQGKETSNWDFDVLVGAGGILSSINDLSKFANAQLNEENKELAFTHKQTFNINENMKIGLGWHIPGKNGKELIWHNGGTGGYASSMALDKENKNGVIILSNVSGFNTQMSNIDKLCFGLIETLNNN